MRHLHLVAAAFLVCVISIGVHQVDFIKIFVAVALFCWFMYLWDKGR